MNEIEKIVKSIDGEVRALLDKMVHTIAEQGKKIAALEGYNKTIEAHYRSLRQKQFKPSSEAGGLHYIDKYRN